MYLSFEFQLGLRTAFRMVQADQSVAPLIFLGRSIEIPRAAVRQAPTRRPMRWRPRPVEIEAEASFASVLLYEVEPHVADVRQGHAADVAQWWLDLDDVGTQVPKGLRAVRAGEHSGEVDDAQALRSRIGLSSSPPFA
jgi:hypothetical protein